MNQNLKQRIEAEAEAQLPYKTDGELEDRAFHNNLVRGMRDGFVIGGLFALEMEKWIEIEKGKIPEIPVDEDNRSVNCILTDGEGRASAGYYNFRRQMWFWNDMAMQNATHYMVQPLPTLPTNKNS